MTKHKLNQNNENQKGLTKEQRLKVYLEIEILLNDFFEKAKFCENNCINKKYSMSSNLIPGKIGCCDQDYFEYLSEFDEKFPLLRKKRLEKYGIPKINNEKTFRGPVCRYHSNAGCVLKDYKPIPCLSWICNNFKSYLFEKYSIDYLPYEIKSFLENILLDKISKQEISKFINKIKSMTNKLS